MGHPVRFVRALLAGGALVALLQMPTGVRAVDLQGQTWFASPPWKVDFRNYYTYVMQTGGEYYF
ncbi:MAG: hypothetical protein ACKOE9_04770, partial [Vulcanococcus sp.]